MGRSLVTGIFFLVSISIFCQSYGLIEDDSAYTRLKTYEFQFKGEKAGKMPEEYSLKSYTPIAKDQGSLESCTSWAVVYGALSISHAIKNGIDHRRESTKRAFMPLSVHNRIVKSFGNCQNSNGTKIEDVLELLQTKGALRIKDFNVSLEDCDTIPSEILQRKATQNTIDSYFKLFG